MVHTAKVLHEAPGYKILETKKRDPDGSLSNSLAERLVRYNNVLCIAKVSMLNSNSVVTRSQVVLDNDAVTADDIFLCYFLRYD